MAANRRVVLTDPFYFGESRFGQRDYLWALLISAVGDRPLGIQANQIGAVTRWLATERRLGPVTLEAVGPRTSVIALVAGALDEKAIGTLRVHQPLLSLKEVLAQNQKIEDAPELFCFGLLEAFDLKQITALSAPRQVESPDGAERLAPADLAELEAFFDMLE
jgi:hypothetical protein